MMQNASLSNAEMGLRTDESSQQISRRVAMQAAEWFVLLGSPEVSAAEMGEFQRWRSSSPEHEKAWLRVEHVSQRAGILPSMIAAPVLRRESNVDRRKAIKTLALLIIAPPATLLAWREFDEVKAERYATTTGEQREVVLADGTKIKLNTRSEIQVDYNAHARLVTLREGEILIETARDYAPMQNGESRPFLMQTKHGRVRAIGTRFNVRQESNESAVAVFQGAVELLPKQGEAGKVLNAGQQGRFDLVSIGEFHDVDSYNEMWAHGVLAVHDMRLDEFVAELSRYRRGYIRCDASVANLRISGAFQLADTDRVLQNLIELLPVEVVFYTRYWANVVAREKV